MIEKPIIIDDSQNICNTCNGNHYIKIREVWTDTSETKKEWYTKPCPECINIDAYELEQLDHFKKVMALI